MKSVRILQQGVYSLMAGDAYSDLERQRVFPGVL